MLRPIKAKRGEISSPPSLCGGAMFWKGFRIGSVNLYKYCKIG
jgi:hypothetical protein